MNWSSISRGRISLKEASYFDLLETLSSFYFLFYLSMTVELVF